MTEYKFFGKLVDATGAGFIAKFKGTIEPIAPQPPVMPDIPHLAEWEERMLTLGEKWRSQAMGELAFGVESQVWYYDGARVYQQIGDYTQDASWYEAADSIMRQYAAYIPAKPPGYRIFPHGFLMAWLRTGEQQYADWLRLLYKNASYIQSAFRYCRVDDQWGPGTIREAAFATDVLICMELITGARDPLLDVGIFKCLIPDLEAFTTDDVVYTAKGKFYLGQPVAPGGGYINNFMIGLALATLIDYYDMTVAQGAPDERIPPVVKKVLDFMWDNCMEPFSGAQFYNSDPTETVEMRPVDPKDPDSLKVHYTASSLNQLTSPAYAWYGLHFDPAYHAKFDAMWSAGILGAGTNSNASVQAQDYSFHGKAFSQNYRLGFDGMRYRSGNPKSAILARASPR